VFCIRIKKKKYKNAYSYIVRNTLTYSYKILTWIISFMLGEGSTIKTALFYICIFIEGGTRTIIIVKWKVLDWAWRTAAKVVGRVTVGVVYGEWLLKFKEANRQRAVDTTAACNICFSGSKLYDSSPILLVNPSFFRPCQGWSVHWRWRDGWWFRIPPQAPVADILLKKKKKIYYDHRPHADFYTIKIV